MACFQNTRFEYQGNDETTVAASVGKEADASAAAMPRVSAAGSRYESLM